MKTDSTYSSRTVRFNATDLRISTSQLARYFGGNGYSFSEADKEKARALIQDTLAVVHPAFVYQIWPVTLNGNSNRLRFANGTSLEVPASDAKSGTQLVAVGVCSLGRAFDEALEQKSRAGDLYDAMLMDAAGVWLLEDLSDRCIRIIRTHAEKIGLYAGCHYGPGYGEMPVERQADLFALVDAGMIGVGLNASHMMQPVKSISFLVNFSSQPMPETNAYKCRRCHLERCQFRVCKYEKA